MPKKKTVAAKKINSSTVQLKTREETIETKNNNLPVKNTTKKKLLIVFLVLIVIGVLYSFKSLFIAATVNGQPIARLTIIKALEKQYGKTDLQGQIRKLLILQEAKKQNITVSQKEIDDEIKKIEKELSSRGQTLEQVMAAEGITKNEVAEQITIKKMIEKMLSKDIKVTEKEADDYIEKNKSNFPEGTDFSKIKGNIKDQLLQQKLNEKFQAWIEGLQKKAQINYFVNY